MPGKLSAWNTTLSCAAMHAAPRRQSPQVKSSAIRVAICAVMIGCMAGTSTSRADTLRLSFSGTTTSSSSTGIMFESLPTFTIGTAFSGYIDFDSSIPDSNALPTLGMYTNSIAAYRINIGGTEFILDPIASENVFYTGDNHVQGVPMDLLQPYLRGTTLQGDLSVSGADWASQLNLWSQDTNVFTSDALPTSIPAISFFDFRSNVTMWSTPADFNNTEDLWYWEGELTSASLASSPVPLPAAVWLLLSGLGGLGAIARKRSAVRLQAA